MSDEAHVQSLVRLEASRRNQMLWRNNSGACRDDTGRVIRYGLGNDSARLNAVIKSSDLIGVTPVVVTQDMVGRVVGLFTAYECKHSDWRGVSNDRERAQQKFLDIVNQYGGIGRFITGVHDM